MGTYALIDDVQARLAGRPAFGVDTKPSQAQVETWIDEAEAFVAAAVGDPKRVLVKHVRRPGRANRCCDAIDVRKGRIVAFGDGSSCFAVFVKMRQFYVQNSSLDRIEA